ncbi:hypothetical protein [Roseomonas sp. 18066]|uniref:hypothetical protein n=1 Tax=Roseomonas sp. 18066 TaxID=2681412 RepID=UPI00135A9093|nr:hypothetical protein [Roseomonas sp. 18066]
MILSRYFGMALLAGLLALAGAPAAQAQDDAGYSLRAAFGGAVPFARKDSYVVANLVGQKGGKVAVASTLPLSSLRSPIFDARPQYVLGGDIALGRFGPGDLSLDGQIAAGAERLPDEPRPLLGLARIRLVF